MNELNKLIIGTRDGREWALVDWMQNADLAAMDEWMGDAVGVHDVQQQ